MSQVWITDSLRTQSLAKHPNLKKLTPEERKLLLDELEAKERAHNPPQLPPKDEPA